MVQTEEVCQLISQIHNHLPVYVRNRMNSRYINYEVCEGFAGEMIDLLDRYTADSGRSYTLKEWHFVNLLHGVLADTMNGNRNFEWHKQQVSNLADT